MVSPLKFSVSARREIAAGLDRLRSKAGDDLIPAKMWVDSNINNGQIPSGVIIGAYTKSQRDELVGHMRNFEGFEYVLSVSTQDLVRFLGKTLDFKDGKFILV
jgi:hypothetical protein